MRTVYLTERKLPTYHDLAEYYDKRGGVTFEFDHYAPSRGRYRTHEGIRVYESGFVEVESYVYRYLDLRYNLARQYGLCFLLPKECYGVKFFTPDNVPVAASAITTGMLFLDGQTKRAYSYWTRWARGAGGTNEQASITFAAPGAVPVAHAQVRADLPDKERVKAVLREHKDFFKVCATTALLTQGTHLEAPAAKTVMDMRVDVVLRALLNGEALDFAAVPLHTQVCIGEHVGGLAEVGIRAKLTALATKNHVFPYLKIVLASGHG